MIARSYCDETLPNSRRQTVVLSSEPCPVCQKKAIKPSEVKQLKASARLRYDRQINLARTSELETVEHHCGRIKYVSSPTPSPEFFFLNFLSLNQYGRLRKSKFMIAFLCGTLKTVKHQTPKYTSSYFCPNLYEETNLLCTKRNFYHFS